MFGFCPLAMLLDKRFANVNIYCRDWRSTIMRYRCLMVILFDKDSWVECEEVLQWYDFDSDFLCYLWA